MKGYSSSSDRAGGVRQTEKVGNHCIVVYSFPAVTFIFKKDIINYTCPLNHSKDFKPVFMQTVMHYRVSFITFELLWWTHWNDSSEKGTLAVHQFCEVDDIFDWNVFSLFPQLTRRNVLTSTRRWLNGKNITAPLFFFFLFLFFCHFGIQTQRGPIYSSKGFTQ